MKTTQQSNFIVVKGDRENGFEMVDNGKVTKLTRYYPGEPHTLILPDNSANRRYLNDKKVDAANGELTLHYKATRTLGPSRPRKGMEHYLEGEDKKKFLELLEKAKAVKAKPKTELEKAQEALKRAEARLAELQKQ